MSEYFEDPINVGYITLRFFHRRSLPLDAYARDEKCIVCKKERLLGYVLCEHHLALYKSFRSGNYFFDNKDVSNIRTFRRALMLKKFKR
jgi:hypothetical protein